MSGHPDRMELWLTLSTAGDIVAVVAMGSAFGLVFQGEAPPFLTAAVIGGGVIASAKWVLKIRWMLRRSVR